MRHSWIIPRRTLLRGIGAALALPLLDVMAPVLAADEPEATTEAPLPRFRPPRRPVRFAVFYLPMGTLYPEWKPEQVGVLGELRPLLKPMQPYVKDLTFVTGCWHRNGAKDWQPHLPDESTFLLGTVIKKDVSVMDVGGISVDQLAGRCTGAITRLPSIAINLQRPSGGNSAGYNVGYHNSLSWSSPTTPVNCEGDPRRLFDRLFRGTGGTIADVPGARLALGDEDRASVLDLVQEQARGLRAKVSVADRRKLDEYLTSVRDVEARLEREMKAAAKERRIDPAAIRAITAFDHQIPAGDGRDHQARLRLMLDLMVLAFWSDTTRVATFMPSNVGGFPNMSFVPGVKGGHHEMSHHRGDPEKKDAYRRINVWYLEQFAYLVQRLKAIEEGDATLLDNSIALYGSGISDGDTHAKPNLPIMLAGRAGGVFRSGRHLAMPEKTPLCNLYVSVLQAMGVQTERFSDSTRAMNELTQG